MSAPSHFFKPVEYKKPTSQIIRQPQKRGYRFRYASEGLTHGGIRGEPSEGEKEKNLYPAIKISGYRGRAKVVLTIVTHDKSNLHAHSLIVDRQVTKGYHVFSLEGENPAMEFPSIGIQHIDKKNQTRKLKDRILQSQFLKRYGWSNSIQGVDAKQYEDIEAFTEALQDRDAMPNEYYDRITKQMVSSEEELDHLEKKATDLSKTMDMSKCRLSFQVFCQDRDGHFSRKLESIYSDVIYDAKTTSGAQLKILRVSKVVSSVAGDEEVWLLGDKLNPDDIEVHFFEDSSNWEDRKSVV